MTSRMLSRVYPFVVGLKPSPPVFRTLTTAQNLTVEHDRQNRRFTVVPGGGTGSQEEHAILQYKYTGKNEVDLMSTYVPETFRGRGVAALLSQAALDFVVEENLKAHVSCWYIKKFIEANPEHHYKERIIT